MSDTDVLSEEPSSPLSTALDTAVLEASLHATGGIAESFATTTSESSQYVKQGGKVYLSVDHTANLKKGTAPSWIWDHGDELRLLAGDHPQKNWRCSHCPPLNQTIIPVNNTTWHAAEHLSKKYKVYKAGTEPTPRRSIGQQVTGTAYSALVSTVQAERFRYLLVRWIVCMHVALSVVEHESFRELILYVCPALESLLMRTGNTIRR
jgi:hypothetical protein